MEGTYSLQSADTPLFPSVVLMVNLIRHYSAMYVDVRDIAQVHTLALLKPEAGDNRFIISAGPYKWQDFGKHNARVRFSYGGS